MILNKLKNPLDIIVSETPNFSDQEAIDIVKSNYEIDVTVKKLVSERDQNFLIETQSRKKQVFKIANCEEDPIVTDFQIKALTHIENKGDSRVITPTITNSISGKDAIQIRKNDKIFTARIVSYLEGEPLWTSPNSVPDNELAGDMGRYLARLGKALKDFSHAGSNQSLLWDMKQALFLRDIISHISDKESQEMVTEVLNVFEKRALPTFDSIRWQVIHNDMNPDNVLIDTKGNRNVCGIIDFGDMVYSPLIIDLAVAAAYLEVEDGNPLNLINHFVAGYNSENALDLNEINILFDLIKVRVATTVAIAAWRKSFRDPDDPYLVINSDDGSRKFLERLFELPREHAIQSFRQICASSAK
jgi:Ser/Thr protein kinase RdoA (MazF antagonist)